MQQDSFDGIPRPAWASSTQFSHHIWSDVQHEAKRLGFSFHKIADESVTYPDSEDWDKFIVRKAGLSKEFRRPVQEEEPRGRGFTEAVLWMREQSKAMIQPVEFTAIPLAKRPADPKAWQVLTEQASQGQAVLLQDGESYTVQFPDEPEPIPFEHLAYHKQLGLYDKRRFPNL